jgi:hypothetical protein
MGRKGRGRFASTEARYGMALKGICCATRAQPFERYEYIEVGGALICLSSFFVLAFEHLTEMN